MPAFTTLPRAKAVPVSPSKWSLLTCGLFALTPLPCALAETAKVEDSTLTLGTVTVQGSSASSGPLSTSSVLSSVDILAPTSWKKCRSTTAGNCSAVRRG
jgi:iron complex outermembrane receptor protein